MHRCSACRPASMAVRVRAKCTPSARRPFRRPCPNAVRPSTISSCPYSSFNASVLPVWCACGAIYGLLEFFLAIFKYRFSYRFSDLFPYRKREFWCNDPELMYRNLAPDKFMYMSDDMLYSISLLVPPFVVVLFYKYLIDILP
jgi:hypothetical protein